MDSYQAVYDAVRSKFGYFDGDSLTTAISQQFDISFAVESVRQEYLETAYAQQEPSVLYRPKVYPDGNQWCALYGRNLVEGVCGFGDTPAEAINEFNKAWKTETLEPKDKPNE